MDEEQPIRTIHNEQELDEIFAQAEAEGWKELALMDLSDAGIRLAAAHRTHAFCLASPLGTQASALARLRTLKALSLFSQQITDQGVIALRDLPSLSRLCLVDNQISDQGAIALSNLSNLSSLELSDNQITDKGAITLAKLPHLSSLILNSNQITDKGAIALAGLPNLSNLSLNSHQITDKGVTALAKIPKLTSLTLNSYQITDKGVIPLAKIPKLTSLALSSYKITNQSAVALSRLSNLSSLSLGSSQITDAGAIAVAKLPRLQLLSLHRLHLSAGGLHRLLDVLCNSPSGASLRSLLLSAAGTRIPQELLRSGDAQAILAAHRAYKASEGLQPLNEAKLLVVGEEYAGKTSLIRYLIDDKPCNPSQPKTVGVELREQIDVSKWRQATSTMSLRVWDFGGQEVKRGTHRYFLTERSLYLLVLDERREDGNYKRVQEWMDMIRTHGGGSPVLVVVNKSDDISGRLLLDREVLKRAHPSVVDIVRTSCAPGDHARATIQKLRERIADLLATSDQLREVRKPVPQEWARVRDAIVAKARQHRKLPIGEFEQLCRDQRIEDASTQRALLRLLHDLGVVVAHGLRRESTAVLSVTLLDPNWLTTAIYSLTASNTVVQQRGELRHDQLAELLPEYTGQDHEYVLHMMMDRETGLRLAFRLPTADNDPIRYLLPDALPQEEPKNKNWPTSLVLRFKYEHGIPIGLMARFIVEAHNKLTNTRWRNGAILKIHGCAVLVFADPSKNYIDVKIDGSTNGAEAPRDALSVVRAYFDDVHKTYAEVAVKECVPLPDNTDVDVSYAHLRKLENQHGAKYLYQPDGADHEYTVGDLLEGIEREPLRHREREWREHSPLSFYASDRAHVEIHAGQLATTNTGPSITTTTIGSGTATSPPTLNAGSKTSGEPGNKPTDARPDHPAPAPATKGLPWWKIAAFAALAVVGMGIVVYLLPAPWNRIIGGIASAIAAVFLLVNSFNPVTVYRRLLAFTVTAGFGLTATGILRGSVETPDAKASFQLGNELPSLFFFAWAAIVAILAWRDHHHQPRP